MSEPSAARRRQPAGSAPGSASTDGTVDVRVGKVELGQGILTALAQIAADELGCRLARSGWSPPTPSTGPDEGLTAGSLSVLQSGPALRHVGAVVRRADPRTEVDPTRCLRRPHRRPRSPTTDLRSVTPARPTLRRVGRPAAKPRLDLPDKVLGRPRYLADLRPDGLLHGRVLRPPSPRRAAGRRSPRTGRRRASSWSATARSSASSARARPTSIAAARRSCATRRLGGARHPPRRGRPRRASSAPARTTRSRSSTTSRPAPTPHTARVLPAVPGARVDRAELRHGAVDADGERRRVEPQPGHPRAARARSPAPSGSTDDAWSVEHVESAGCYGHNAADDAAFDAVLLARAVAGRPVQVRWTRPDELTWAPLSSAMTADVAAATGRRPASPAGPTTSGARGTPRGRATPGRPGCWPAPTSAAAGTSPPADRPADRRRRRQHPQRRADLRRRPAPGHRAPPGRDAAAHLGDARRSAPTSTSSRSSRFMDELAEAAGVDPLDFRLAHLDDPRAAHVVETAARPPAGASRCPTDVGRGLGFARYKEQAAPGARSSPRSRRGATSGSPADGRRRHRAGGEPRRRPQPARGRGDPVDELDAEGAGPLRPAPDHQRRLGDLPDPALHRGAAGRRAPRRQRRTVARRRRGAQGPTAAAIANAVHRRARRAGARPAARRRRRSSAPSRPRNSRGETWTMPRISYVPMDQMDEQMRAEMHRCAREGTPRAGELSGAGPRAGRVLDVRRLLGGVFRSGVCDHAIKELARLYITAHDQVPVLRQPALVVRRACRSTQDDELLNFETLGPRTTTGRRPPSPTRRPSPGTSSDRDGLWERLHAHFTEPELVELGCFVALTFGQQSWIRLLDDRPPGVRRRRHRERRRPRTRRRSLTVPAR